MGTEHLCRSPDSLEKGPLQARSVREYLAPFSEGDRKSTRLNSSHLVISYAVFCLKKKKNFKTDPLSYWLGDTLVTLSRDHPRSLFLSAGDVRRLLVAWCLSTIVFAPSVTSLSVD